MLVLLLSAFACAASADTLKLPDSLKIIKDRAFMGDQALETVILPEGLERIGEYAFADSSVREINLPSSLQYIADNAFDNHASNLVLKVEKGSLGESYAKEHNLLFAVVKYEPDVIVTDSWNAFAIATASLIQDYCDESKCK